MRSLLALCLALAVLAPCRAQQVQADPGRFDFDLLNLSWAPEFCASGVAHRPGADNSLECGSPHGFILHGLWPSDADGSQPADCSNAPGPQHPEKNLDLTPDLSLLSYEWHKHGTCSGLPADTFFSTAREAVSSVHIPGIFHDLAKPLMLTPDAILANLYQSNPGFPPGSFALTCGNNRLTAIEACFDRNTLTPIACPSVKSCHANNVKITPEITGSIVQ